MTHPFTNALCCSPMLAPMRTTALLLPLLLLVALSTAMADERRSPRHDHDDARSAVARGERVALGTIIADALRRHPGRLIEAEYEDGDYEIEILREDGVVVELEYDAVTGKLGKTEVEDD
jgi:uncharacterized membrane protein YkoI